MTNIHIKETSSKQQVHMVLSMDQLNYIHNCVDYATNQLHDSNISLYSNDEVTDDSEYYRQMSISQQLLDTLLIGLGKPNNKIYAAYHVQLDNKFYVLDITDAEQTMCDELGQQHCMTAAIATVLVNLATKNHGNCIHWGSLSECYQIMSEYAN